MAGPEVRRSVEEREQALYGTSDLSGIPGHRGSVVRKPWPQVARNQMAQSENRSEPSGRFGA
jgi:hypothetical protein